MPAIRIAILAAVFAAGAAVDSAPQQDAAIPGLEETLAQLSRRVQLWYGRAQNVVAIESVTIQPLDASMTPSAVPRRLAFELRVQWDPERTGPAGSPVAHVVRQPVPMRGTVNDRRDPGCMDPKPVSPEPLAMLLPERLHESVFALAGTGRIDGRPALLLDFRGDASLPPDIRWTEACVSVALPGRSRGRIWIDRDTFDVLRMDDRLVGAFSFDVPTEHVRRGAARSMVIERAESSIRYRRVGFDDPAETLMLPASIDTVSVIRGAGTQRMRISQRFSDYRRFLTGGRIVE